MSVASVDIKDKLVALSLGTFGATSGWGIFISTEPATPVSTITLMDVQAWNRGRLANPAIPATEYPCIQVRVRDSSFMGAANKIEAIVAAIDNIAKWTTTTYCYHSVFLQGEPVFLQKDDQGRTIWVATFKVVRERLS